MEENGQPPFQQTAIKVLLDCSNTQKVREGKTRKESKIHQLAITPWNHRAKKQQRYNKNKGQLKHLFMTTKAKQSFMKNRHIQSTPKREKILSSSYRRSQPHNVVDLNQSLEQQHIKRQKEFVVRHASRKHRTLQKF